jgi:hypothetical protein
MKQELFKLIRKHHLNISIYTAEIFERRCQEEIIRSDEDQSSFVYLEFEFDEIKKIAQNDEDALKFWEVMLEALNRNNRGSDILGFLENDTGLGMLLLDSKIEGWIRVRGRILQHANSEGFKKAANILAAVVKPIVYPTCIADAQDLKAIEAVSQELAAPVESTESAPA